MNKVRVVMYGVGVIGSMITKALLEKNGVTVVGAVDVAKDKVGKDLSEVLGREEKSG